MFRPNWSTDLAVAVLEKERVYAATSLAIAAGVRASMRRGGVLTIAPHTMLLERSPAKEAQALRRVAIALLQFSPNVIEGEEESILIEVSTSLRLFGGLRRLRSRIRGTARTMGFSADIGCAPTAQAAWLHARAGGGSSLKIERFARRLDGLSVGLLPSARPIQEWLDNLGCRTLAQLRRLPRAGLQRRCGKAINDALDCALGEAPEVFDWIEAPPSFSARVELPDRIEHADATLAYGQGLVAQLVGWLVSHHLAVTRLHFVLEHERGREAIPPTNIDIALAEPTWSGGHLVRLLKERLARIEIAGPMIAVRLEVDEVQPLAPPSETLFPEPGGTPEDHSRVMEVLTARLGAENILRPEPVPDYRPEVANSWVPATGKAPKPTPLPQLPRPTWLLDKPIALLMRDHRPYYGSPLRIVSPPERLESGWWDGQLQTRDYYVAQGNDHSFYWIYQERLGSREGDETRWYLHGLFG